MQACIMLQARKCPAQNWEKDDPGGDGAVIWVSGDSALTLGTAACGVGGLALSRKHLPLYFTKTTNHEAHNS
jgi:hypothetical protein